MTKFDPGLSEAFSGDESVAPRSFSLSEDPQGTGGGVPTLSKFGVSTPIVQSLEPAADQFSSLSAIEKFMMMQASNERLLREERDAERRRKEEDREERRREKDEQRKFEREQLAVEKQLAEKKETARLVEAAKKELARLTEAAA